jgi:hypothetical protein
LSFSHRSTRFSVRLAPTGELEEEKEEGVKECAILSAPGVVYPPGRRNQRVNDERSPAQKFEGNHREGRP